MHSDDTVDNEKDVLLKEGGGGRLRHPCFWGIISDLWNEERGEESLPGYKFI